MCEYLSKPGGASRKNRPTAARVSLSTYKNKQVFLWVTCGASRHDKHRVRARHHVPQLFLDPPYASSLITRRPFGFTQALQINLCATSTHSTYLVPGMVPGKLGLVLFYFGSGHFGGNLDFGGFAWNEIRAPGGPDGGRQLDRLSRHRSSLDPSIMYRYDSSVIFG